MVEVTESFWVPGIAGGPYAGGQEVEFVAELEAQLVASGKAVDSEE